MSNEKLKVELTLDQIKAIEDALDTASSDYDFGDAKSKARFAPYAGILAAFKAVKPRLFIAVAPYAWGSAFTEDEAIAICRRNLSWTRYARGTRLTLTTFSTDAPEATITEYGSVRVAEGYKIRVERLFDVTRSTIEEVLSDE